MNDALVKKIDRAIQYICSFQPTTEPYYTCYSGGKDSDAIRLLCEMAGANYELHNNHTTVDAPETVYYIREVMSRYGQKRTIYDEKDGHRIHHYGEKGFIHFPLKTMWDLIEMRGPATRVHRHCCARLKESGGKGRVKLTGVRWAESTKRKLNSGFIRIVGKPKFVTRMLERSGGVINMTQMGGSYLIPMMIPLAA